MNGKNWYDNDPINKIFHLLDEKGYCKKHIDTYIDPYKNISIHYYEITKPIIPPIVTFLPLHSKSKLMMKIMIHSHEVVFKGCFKDYKKLYYEIKNLLKNDWVDVYFIDNSRSDDK